MTHLLKLAATGFALAAFAAAPASAVTNANECENEGGQVFDVAEGKVCMVPIRAPEYVGEVYDNQQLGVVECTGTEIMDGAWCKVVLIPAPARPDASAPAEVESEASN